MGMSVSTSFINDSVCRMFIVSSCTILRFLIAFSRVLSWTATTLLSSGSFASSIGSNGYSSLSTTLPVVLRFDRTRLCSVVDDGF